MSNPEYECEMGLEETKCAYYVCQGYGWQGGVDVCWLVSVCYLSCFHNANLSLVILDSRDILRVGGNNLLPYMLVLQCGRQDDGGVVCEHASGVRLWYTGIY